MKAPGWKAFVAVVAVFCIWGSDVAAKSPGKGARSAKATVRDVLVLPVRGETVSLKGHVLRRMGPNRYLFGDGTGRIVIEVNDKIMSDVDYGKETVYQLRGNVELRVENPPKINVGALHPTRRS